MAIRMSGLISNMDTDSIVKELMSAQRLKSTRIENKKTKLEWKQDKWKDLNKKIYSFYTDTLSKARLQSSYATKKVSSSDENIATVTATNTAPEGSHTLTVEQLASSQFVTGDKLGTLADSTAITASTKLVDLGVAVGNKITVNAGGKEKTLTVDDKTTVYDFVTTLKDAGLNASFDTKQNRFFISSKQSGYANAFTLTATDTTDLKDLGLSEITKAVTGQTVDINGGANITLVKPKDAIYTYNDVKFTSSSNNISINGLNITLKGITVGPDPDSTTDDRTISLSVSNDTQAVYDMVKNFVKSYNSLLKEMNEDFYAVSAKGFEPLTDDQKESMSDDEIKEWETKIKDSLLRRDDTLSSLLDTMKSELGGSVKVDGKKYALSSFGIKTSADYTENGLLHIDGDKDDSLSASAEDKLMKALTEDPDTVTDALTQLTQKLYDKLTDSMGGTKLRSALTFYNDKDIKNTLDDYKDELSDMETKLKDMEDRYYKQFSAMETALSKMNSQSSSLQSMMGSK